MTDDYDPVTVEVARLRAEIQQRHDRVTDLCKLRSRPTVYPVIVYMRHGSPGEEVYDWGLGTEDMVLGAYRAAWQMIEDGTASPDGVMVGGAMLDMDELDRRYPNIW